MAFFSSKVERGLLLVISGKYHVVPLVRDPEPVLGNSLLIFLILSLLCGGVGGPVKDILYTVVTSETF